MKQSGYPMVFPWLVGLLLRISLGLFPQKTPLSSPTILQPNTKIENKQQQKNTSYTKDISIKLKEINNSLIGSVGDTSHHGGENWY